MAYDPTATKDQLAHAVVGPVAETPVFVWPDCAPIDLPAVDSRPGELREVSNNNKDLGFGSDGTPPDASFDNKDVDTESDGSDRLPT